ncbi:MAG: AMIN domain-containing protein [Candidatus Sulfotelmatobacter sp.]
MHRSLRVAAALLALAMLCSPAPAAGQARALPSIRRVEVLRTPNLVEVEIEASERIIPQTNVLTNPDRLVVDFVNSVPGAQLRSQTVNRAEVKSLRVGLFSSDPPVTRIVFDLHGPQPYQVFPEGRTVIVKVGGNPAAETASLHRAPGPALMNTGYSTQTMPVSTAAPPPPPLDVSFHDGQLSIRASKANLSEVLFAVHQRTGAVIAIPAGAEQEMVVGEFGPAPAPEVLAHLLNGSKFNFLILSSSTDPGGLDRVILSPRTEASMPGARGPLQPMSDANGEADVRPGIASPSQPAPPFQNSNQPDPRAPGDDGPD